jgi:type IX secretion system PorP/SprF family membrane protein
MRVSFLIFFIMIGFTVNAQDPSFTQYLSNPVYLNPAFAGVNGGLRFSSAYKNQWPYVPGKFNTTTAAIDLRSCIFSNVGWGFIFLNGVEGEGLLTTNAAGYVFNYMIENPGRSQVSMALKPAIYSKTVDWSKLVFSDQLDPVLGVVKPTGVVPPNSSATFFDVDAGFLWRFFVPIPGWDDLYNNLGFSVNHIFEPDQSLTGGRTPLPRKITIHGGSMVNIAPVTAQKKIHAVPHFRFNFQNNASGDFASSLKEFDLTSFFVRDPLFIGFNYHNNILPNGGNLKSMAAIAGFRAVSYYGLSYQIAYSFDFGVSRVGNAALSSHEISLILSLESFCLFGSRSGYGKNNSNKCFDFVKKGILPVF